MTPRSNSDIRRAHAACGALAAVLASMPAIAVAHHAPADDPSQAVAIERGLTAASSTNPRVRPTLELAAAEPAGIFRVWTPGGLASRSTDALPLTQRARAAADERAAAGLDGLVDDPAPRCEAPGLPRMLDTPHSIEFVDRGDRILMRFEEWSDERTVYMDPRKGPPTQAHSPTGVSFGRWEGPTLAIFTTYLDARFFDDAGTPLSRAATVLERYTPSADGRRLRWRATVTDPATFTVPVVLEGEMTRAAGKTLEPHACRGFEPSL